ncbi:hypothetical protein [Nocardia terpenica]|uniref:Uncharacterized protein n=1 Tax=Nocardia terpenica TaxID=455432 RepID=A0A164HCK8_9NOCA|nr:hypothetical protein [Nocardia terpenica]KZM68396.1 hypothetical protein AWN90_10945 [Nocardia terpenica]NQE88683.1 hypothetical protein [Nocardia terpenica]
MSQNTIRTDHYGQALARLIADPAAPITVEQARVIARRWFADRFFGDPLWGGDTLMNLARWAAGSPRADRVHPRAVAAEAATMLVQLHDPRVVQRWDGWNLGESHRVAVLTVAALVRHLDSGLTGSAACS